MKKNRLLCLLLALVMLLCLTACEDGGKTEEAAKTAEQTASLLKPEKQEPENQPEPGKEPEKEPAKAPEKAPEKEPEKEQTASAPVQQAPLLERYCGRYLYTKQGEEDQYALELFSIGGRLFGTIRYQWDDETWFDETQVEFEALDESRLQRTDTNECTFTARRSSGFAMAGEYWDGGITLTLKLTADGLTVFGENAGDEPLIGMEQIASLKRIDDYKPMHDSARCMEYLAQTGWAFSMDTVLQTGTAGNWHDTEDGTEYRLDFDRVGNFRMFIQAKDCPAAIYIGAYCQDSMRVHYIAERVGYGEMPFEGEFSVYNENDMLLIDEYGEDLIGILPADGTLILRRNDREAEEKECLQELVGTWYNDEDYTVLTITEDLHAELTASDVLGSEVTDPNLTVEYRQDPDYSGDWYAELCGSFYTIRYRIMLLMGGKLELTETVYYYTDSGEASESKSVLLSPDTAGGHGMG